jgi:hypothetical protein
MRYTPENIKELKRNEVFVFGSNANGHHGGGAARCALDYFHAEWGKAEGMTGQCYAIPTLDKNMYKVDPFELLQSLRIFIRYAITHPEKVFLVTKIGCGIAGWTECGVARLLYIAFRSEGLKRVPKNIILPREFYLSYADREDIRDIYFGFGLLRLMKALSFTDSQREHIFNHSRDLNNALDCIISDCE